MALHLVGSDIVHLDTGTFMWVQLTHFSIDGTVDDRAILAELIASPGYVHDYATPFQSEAALVEPQIHGRWRLSEIHVEQFEPWSATAAKQVIHDWANYHDWTDPTTDHPLRSKADFRASTRSSKEASCTSCATRDRRLSMSMGSSPAPWAFTSS